MVGADNRTASDGTWNYLYDNEGNLVSKSRIGSSEEWDYQYDHRNLMTRAQQWVGGQLQQTIDYAYDVLGRRIERHASDILGGNSTERYGYDGDNVLLDLTGSNALSVRRLFGGGSDEVLSRESAAGALTWYLSDYQGSVIGLAAAEMRKAKLKGVSHGEVVVRERAIGFEPTTSSLGS